MAVLSDSQRLILPIAPIVGAVVGTCAAMVLAAVPIGVFEDVALDSGIASIVSAAAPPLGFTARLLVVLLGGGGLGVISWFATFLILGTRNAAFTGAGVMFERTDDAEEAAPVLRRADAHPDAPARRPLRAERDLGTPFLEVSAAPKRARQPLEAEATAPIAVEPARIVLPTSIAPVAERPLPDDLDQPLAAYAAEALGVRPQIFAPGERLETFALKPVRRDPSDSIHALLDRLERVVQQQPFGQVTPPPPSGIEDTLASLRSMAQRAR